MIRSLIDLLGDCLPIYAAWSKAATDSRPKPPTGDALTRYIKVQAPGTAYTFPTPAVTTNTSGTIWENTKNVGRVMTGRGWTLNDAILSARLWALTIQGPNLTTDVKCRARERGYSLHGVLQKITFGLDGQPKVKVSVKATGQVLELPLDTAHLYSQIAVSGGKVPEGGHTLWPLEAQHDVGFVLLFIYEASVDNAGKIALPLAPFHPSGAGQWTPLREDEKKQLEPLSKGAPDPDGWLEAMTGPGIAVGESPQTVAKVGEVQKKELARSRIIVALSLGTCRERADFEPGGLVGMAKIFPNIMVCSSIDLSTLEATVKIERTPATTVLDSGDGSAHGTCCGAYQEIGALLVADGNEIADFAGLLPLQKPFWGGTFAYVETSANQRLGGQRLHMVDRSKGDRTGAKKFKGGKRLLVTRDPHLSKEYLKSLLGITTQVLTGVEKAPGQGEFDNLHLAPQLKLDLAKAVIPPFAAEGVYVPAVEYTVDAAACHTDRVWMAPFCSHDCFHTHVRWGSKESAKWTKGWDGAGPYKVSGAPMIPLWQDAWLELHGPSSYSYHAKSTYDAKHVAGTWDIVMHHGAAYAQAIADAVTYWKSKMNIGLSQDATLEDSKGQPLDLSNAPLMYWLLRYQVEFEGDKVVATERVQFRQDEVDAVRKF